MLLIDDSSSDTRIIELTTKYEINHKCIKVIRNKENKGFVSNVNIGIDNTNHDIVLLNSDTIVTERWLTKLIISAYSTLKIGTVTPLSNAAGAFSVPELSIENKIPNHLTVDSMGKLLEIVSKNILLSVPTGNGYCMYIKRECLDSVGNFDVDNFKMGYGEENDFCMRAICNGWENIIDENVFVYHKRSASFGNQRQELAKTNREKLNKLHPTFTDKVKNFVNNVQYKAIRERISTEIKDTKEVVLINKKRILYVIHEGGGGTPKTNLDLAKNVSEQFEVFILTSNMDVMQLYLHHRNEQILLKSWKLKQKWQFDLFYCEEYRDIYFDILIKYGFDLVHVRHLFKHSFDLPYIAKVMRIPIVLSFHDFYYVCPSINLVTGVHTFCGGDCDPQMYKCRVPSGHFIENGNTKIDDFFIKKWQNNALKLMEICDVFITTSILTKQTYCKIFPDLKAKDFRIIEHGRDFNIRKGTTNVVNEKKDKIKILIPGNIGEAKGSLFIKKLCEYDKKNRIEFHVIGVYNKFVDGKHIFNHGKYKRDNFNIYVEKINPDFIGVFSMWPETYCHTLTEGWASGIPVIVNKIGVLEERMKNSGMKYYIDCDNIQESFDNIIEYFSNKKEYHRAVKIINNMYFRTTYDMAMDYIVTYKSLVFGRQTTIGIITKYAKGKTVATSYIRTILPFSQYEFFKKNTIKIIKTDSYEERNLFKSLTENHMDCLYIQRNIIDDIKTLKALKKYIKENNVKLIYEIDDDLLNISNEHPQYKHYKHQKKIIQHILHLADKIIVTTQHLKEKIRRQQTLKKDKVVVIENFIDERFWLNNIDRGNKRKNHEKKIVFGYYGTKTHSKDLELVFPIIKKTIDYYNEKGIDLTFELIGGVPKDVELPGFVNVIDVPLKFHDYLNFIDFLKEKTKHWDFAIAPLQDNIFNKSKSDLKYKEYSCLNLAAIYSNVDAYKYSIKNNKNGILVKNDTDTWEKALIKMVDNEGDRINFSKCGYQDIVQNKLLKDNVKNYLEIFKRA